MINNKTVSKGQERGLPCEQYDYVSSARTYRTQRVHGGWTPLYTPKGIKKDTLFECPHFGADYVSRKKQLSVVFFVVNAQKQGVMGARSAL